MARSVSLSSVCRDTFAVVSRTRAASSFFRLAEHLRPLGFTALRRLLLQTLHGGAGLRDHAVVFLLTACAGVLYDLRGLRLRRGELRGMRGLLLLGLGQTPVRLIERVRYLLCAVVQHSG